MAGRLGDTDPRGYPRHARSLTARALRQRVLLLVVVMAFAASASAVILPGALGHKVSHSRRPHSDHLLSAAAKARNLAAGWIAKWVSASADVACDPTMCNVLVAHHVASGEVSPLPQGVPDPLDAVIVVATPVIRTQFGAWRLAHVYAPGVLASFGSGSTEVQVRVVAAGATNYERALQADVAARRSLGTAMLRNSAIMLSGRARRELTAGAVDTRLLANLATLADLDTPVAVLGFGGRGPGASPGMPLLSMDITPLPDRTGDSLEAGAREAATKAAVTKILQFLKAQIAPLDPDHVIQWSTDSGQIVVQVDFGAPTQFGLFKGSQAETTPIAKPPS